MTLHFTPVRPPALAPPQHSLVRSAVTNLDGEAGWESGLTYAPELPGSYRAISGVTEQIVDHRREALPLVEYKPWELEVEDPCDRMWQYDRAEITARLDRAMAATESYSIARELMAGELARADYEAMGGAESDDALLNPHLAAGATVLGAGPVSPKRGLGMLEAEGGAALAGGQVWLHVPRIARPFFPELVKQGQLLFTNVDNVIVSDAGYANTPPDGRAAADGVAWIYATGTTVVRRAPVEHDGPEAETVDTATNRILRRARRIVAAHFDPTAHFAVPITLS